ncbi:MAG: MlaD family protein [Bacteroidales bacterium]|nr:MlaD family protein [Bacteroidales bacterium]
MKIRKEYFVGLVFIAAIALFIWGFNFLKGRNVFNKEKILYGIYDEVSGLTKSNPVSIRGLQVGQVKNIYFEQSMSGKLIVVLSINNDFPIPINSVAEIYSSNLMGSKAVKIIPGNSDVIAQNSDTLQTNIEGSLKDAVNKQVQPIKLKAENLIESIDSIVVVFQTIFNENARENLKHSFENIKNTLGNLEHTTSTIDTFVVVEQVRLAEAISNLEKITNNLDKNKDNITNILANFSAISDSLSKADIPTTVINANKSIEKLFSILDKIDSGEGSTGLLVNSDSLYIHLKFIVGRYA